MIRKLFKELLTFSGSVLCTHIFGALEVHSNTHLHISTWLLHYCIFVQWTTENNKDGNGKIGHWDYLHKNTRLPNSSMMTHSRD